MAASKVQQIATIIDDLAEAKRYLAERGVFPDSAGHYSERDIPAIEEAIRSREWIPRLKQQGGEWVVEIVDTRDAHPESVDVTASSDRVTALLRTLAIALIWLTDEEAEALLESETREMMGMSAQEFRDRWRAGQLPEDDPAVTHIRMLLRTLG